MTTEIDGATALESSEVEGTEESPEQKTTTQQDPLTLARKRQAGAEAARQEAARQLAEAQAKLAKYEDADRTADQQKAADVATLQAKLEAAERRAAEADVKAEARILDIKYPNARSRLPEITDEVRLSEFEQLFSEGPGEPATPQNPNETNRAASGDPTGSKPKEESSEDILARLKSMGRPDWL
jgi:multidrug efflux pump subunit AcrA (membrane-fusion protein)